MTWSTRRNKYKQQTALQAFVCSCWAKSTCKINHRAHALQPFEYHVEWTCSMLQPSCEYTVLRVTKKAEQTRFCELHLHWLSNRVFLFWTCQQMNIWEFSPCTAASGFGQTDCDVNVRHITVCTKHSGWLHRVRLQSTLPTAPITWHEPGA